MQKNCFVYSTKRWKDIEGIQMPNLHKNCKDWNWILVSAVGRPVTAFTMELALDRIRKKRRKEKIKWEWKAIKVRLPDVKEGSKSVERELL